MISSGLSVLRQSIRGFTALTATEQAAVLTLINTGEFAGPAIEQIWTRELDEGRFL